MMTYTVSYMRQGNFEFWRIALGFIFVWRNELRFIIEVHALFSM